MLTLKVEAMCSQAEGCWQPLEAEPLHKDTQKKRQCEDGTEKEH